MYIPTESNMLNAENLEAKFVNGPSMHWDIIKNRIVTDQFNSTIENPVLVLKDVTDIILENSQNFNTEILINICDYKYERLKKKFFEYSIFILLLCTKYIY